MKTLALVMLCCCGLEVDYQPPPITQVVHGPDGSPALVISGDKGTDAGAWNPGEISVDDRDAGWPVSCLNGATPFLRWEHQPWDGSLFGRDVVVFMCGRAAP